MTQFRPRQESAPTFCSFLPRTGNSEPSLCHQLHALCAGAGCADDRSEVHPWVAGWVAWVGAGGGWVNTWVPRSLTDNPCLRVMVGGW